MPKYLHAHFMRLVFLLTYFKIYMFLNNIPRMILFFVDFLYMEAGVLKKTRKGIKTVYR
jgi:hypothetical protein